MPSAAPTKSTAVVEPGKIRDTPTDPNYNGTDSLTSPITTLFPYTTPFRPKTSNTATVTITITEVNDAPIAYNDAAGVAEDSGTGVLVDVRANDKQIGRAHA